LIILTIYNFAKSHLIITIEQARKDYVEAKRSRLEDEALSHVHHQRLHQGENPQAN
jgi:low affinity Fe/Cu permease